MENRVSKIIDMFEKTYEFIRNCSDALREEQIEKIVSEIEAGVKKNWDFVNSKPSPSDQWFDTAELTFTGTITVEDRIYPGVLEYVDAIFGSDDRVGFLIDAINEECIEYTIKYIPDIDGSDDTDHTNCDKTDERDIECESGSAETDEQSDNT